MKYGKCILPWRKSSRSDESGGGFHCVQVTVVLLKD